MQRFSVVKSSTVARRIVAWQELLECSTQLALAGLKQQGYSAREAWAVWCRRWARAARDHQQTSRRIAAELRVRDRNPSA